VRTSLLRMSTTGGCLQKECPPARRTTPWPYRGEKVGEMPLLTGNVIILQSRLRRSLSALKKKKPKSHGEQE